MQGAEAPGDILMVDQGNKLGLDKSLYLWYFHALWIIINLNLLDTLSL